MTTDLPNVVRAYIEAYNRKDVAALLECVADSVVFENVSNSGQGITTEGRAAFAELADRAASMFTSREQVVRTCVIANGTVAPEIDWTGIPAVDLGPMKAGERVSMRGASFITMTDDGKMSRIVDIS